MTIYEQYIGTIKQLEVLEKMKDELRKEIENSLPEDGFKDELINCYWTNKKNWKYSSRVEELNTELKSTKKKEEEEGIATFEEVKQLTIKVK